MSDIPSELKRLVRCVMRTFYGLIPRLIMDALMRYGSMQRDQLATLLKLDKNKIQAQLATLSGEKFIKTRIKMETTAADEPGTGNGHSKRPLSAREQSQRTARHTFYFVNFRGFLNSVKYKLDHVRRRLEAQEKEAMYNRSLFRCLQCNHKYSELDVIRLFDRDRNAYFCYICKAELAEEGESNEPPSSSETVTPASTNGYTSANSTASTARSSDAVPSKQSSDSRPDSSKSWSSQASNDEQVAPAIKSENGLRVKTEPNAAPTTNGKTLSSTQSVSDSPVKVEAAAKNGDGSAFQKKSQVARFHEQTRSIVDLIRICERLDLTSVFAAAEISGGYDAAQANASASNWGDMKQPRTASLFAAPSGVKREPNSKAMRLNLSLVIEMDGMGQSNANNTPKVKETPHWLKNDAASTFKSSEPLATPLSPPPGSARSSLSFGFGASGATSPTPISPAVDEERVKRLVFQREVMRTRREPSIAPAVTIVKKERIDEQIDCSSLNFDWLNRPILAGGLVKPFSALTQKDVARMTETERAEYVRIGQQLYELCD